MKQWLSNTALLAQISVQDLTSHFFRNIHNQVKQQVGKVVRDCIVTVPDEGSPFFLSPDALKRLSEAAQAGGLRIKSFVSDSSAALLAYGLDARDAPAGRTLVLDVGWSKTELTLLDVSGGLFVPVTRRQSAAVSGSVFVGLLTDHCAKVSGPQSPHPMKKMMMVMVMCRTSPARRRCL